MEIYSIKHFFLTTRKKWLVVFGLLLIDSVISLISLNSDLRPTGAGLVAWEYILCSFSLPLSIVLITPLTFYYLICDLYVRDIENGYISYIFMRISNRVYYYTTKVIIIIIAASCFFINKLAVLFLVSFIWKMPFQGDYLSPLLKYQLHSEISMIWLFILQYALFVMYLSTLGVFTLTLTTLFNNTLYSTIALSALIVQSHAAVFNDHSKLLYCPLAQGIFALHMPFYLYGEYTETQLLLQNFTVFHSMVYLFIVAVTFYTIGCTSIRIKDISNKGNIDV